MAAYPPIVTTPTASSDPLKVDVEQSNALKSIITELGQNPSRGAPTVQAWLAYYEPILDAIDPKIAAAITELHTAVTAEIEAAVEDLRQKVKAALEAADSANDVL